MSDKVDIPKGVRTQRSLPRRIAWILLLGGITISFLGWRELEYRMNVTGKLQAERDSFTAALMKLGASAQESRR